MIKPSHCPCLTQKFKTTTLLGLLLGLTILSTSAAQGQESRDPILLKADALYTSGKAEQAQSLYEAFLKMNPLSSDARIGLARIAERRSEFSLAEQYLEPELQLVPKDANGLAELGHLYDIWPQGASGEKNIATTRAQGYLKQALQVDPNNLLALTYMAQWQLHQDNRPAAEKTLYRVIGQKPTFVPALQVLSELYLKVPDVNRAKQSILQTLELEPQNPQNYLLLARLFALKKQAEESVRYAMKSQQLDFGVSPEREQLLAEQYTLLGDIPQAIEFYEQLLTSRPDDPQILMKVGELYAQQGNTPKSIERYQNAIQQDPTLLTGLIAKAQTLSRIEKAKEALQAWRHILTLKPGTVEALHGLASVQYLTRFYNQVNPDSVKQDLKLFNENKPSSSSPLIQLDNLKLLFTQQGEFLPAQQAQLKVLSLSHDDLAAGEALFFLGQYPQAQERFDAVDGQTAQGYLAVADRLLLDQELVSSQILYQRGAQLTALGEIAQGQNLITAKKALAEQKVEAGNLPFSQKRYTVALSLYDQAHQVYREWEVPCLRLAETYERIGENANAFKAYQEAVTINPTLMQSKGFAKKYRQMERKARKG